MLFYLIAGVFDRRSRTSPCDSVLYTIGSTLDGRILWPSKWSRFCSGRILNYHSIIQYVYPSNHWMHAGDGGGGESSCWALCLLPEVAFGNCADQYCRVCSCSIHYIDSTSGHWNTYVHLCSGWWIRMIYNSPVILILTTVFWQLLLLSHPTTNYLLCMNNIHAHLTWILSSY